MKRADVVMNFLEKYSSVFVCDDCVSEQCKIFPRQQINNITRTLYAENKIWKEIDRYLWQIGKEVFPNKY